MIPDNSPVPKDPDDRAMWMATSQMALRLLQRPQDDIWMGRAEGRFVVDVNPYSFPPNWLLRRGIHNCDIHRTVKRVDEVVHVKTFKVLTPNYPTVDQIKDSRESMLQVSTLWQDLLTQVQTGLTELFDAHPDKHRWWLPIQLLVDFNERGKKIVVQIKYVEMVRVRDFPKEEDHA